jgi:hypothetical protein
VDAGEAQNLQGAAQLILSKESELMTILAGYETQRLTEKNAVKNATTIEGINNGG